MASQAPIPAGWSVQSAGPKMALPAPGMEQRRHPVATNLLRGTRAFYGPSNPSSASSPPTAGHPEVVPEGPGSGWGVTSGRSDLLVPAQCPISLRLIPLLALLALVGMRLNRDT